MARGLTLVLVAALALALAVPAGATVVPGKSIAGVALLMRPKQVRAKLGAPRSIKREPTDFGQAIEYRYPRYRVLFAAVTGETPFVNAIVTTDPGQRTARGIGVGSTVAQVRARVPGVRCDTHVCRLGKLVAGDPITTFSLRRGRVVDVAVEFVAD